MKNKQLIAEEKPFKFGESLTANPEPSILDSSSKACVETRRKVCIKCGNEIPQTKYKSAKFCSSKCRAAYGSLKWRVEHGLIKKPGVGSGNNQTKNIEDLSPEQACKRARNLLPKECNRCKDTKHLVAHHIDHDRSNNKLENFEILCKRCHQKHHEIRDINTGKYIKG